MEKVKIRLQGHEKFTLREGWLTKGLVQVEKNPKVFQGKEGTDIFGIGNNMVKSLRYWLKAFGLTMDRNREGTILTTLGKLILKYDKYFEINFTLWLLHSNISKNIDEATTWYMFFNKCNLEEFSREEIKKYIYREINKYVKGRDFSVKSMSNDIDVLLNMYGKVNNNSDPEDKIISPLAKLNLIKKIDDRYIKNQPDRRIINEWIILYELAVQMEEKNSISIESISVGEGSISAIYQLTPLTINEYLDKLDALEYIHVDRTAGLDMIYKNKDFTPEQIIDEYYRMQK